MAEICTENNCDDAIDSVSGSCDSVSAMPKGYTLDAVTEMIRKAVRAAGTQQAFAAVSGEARTAICDICNGRRDPSPRLLEYLGLEHGYIAKSDRAA